MKLPGKITGRENTVCLCTVLILNIISKNDL